MSSSTRRSALRRLILLAAALATFVMHTGLSTACTPKGSTADAAMAAVAVHHDSAGEHPLSPGGSAHDMGQRCQARLPSTSPGSTGAPVALAVFPSTFPAAWLAGWRELVAPRWAPPPEQSSLCVWRI
jgi:hypothetical protein